MKEISAGIIIYRRTNEGPKFLLLYHGGRYWNFPKGKIDKSAGKETTFKTALRETKEETGLGSRDLMFKNWFKAHDNYTFVQKRKKIFKTVVYYLAETKKREIKISEEHSGYGWFSYKDAARMLIYSNLKNHLRRAYETIQGRRLSRHKKNTPRQSRNL